jgi:hypothetical protein
MARHELDLKPTPNYYFRLCLICNTKYKPHGKNQKYCTKCQQKNLMIGVLKRMNKLREKANTSLCKVPDKSNSRDCKGGSTNS